MQQNKQKGAFINVLLLIIALMLSGSGFAAKTAVDMATQAELDAAVAELNNKINDLNTAINKITPPVRQIGDHLPDFSVVFWVDETGQHGLSAWPHDDLPGNWYEAMERAESHGPGWRLPNKHELNLLYLQQDIVGGFIIEAYWSSTELFNSESAVYQFFRTSGSPSGHQCLGDCPKVIGQSPLGVRAIKSF